MGTSESFESRRASSSLRRSRNSASGALIFVFFYLASSKNGQHNLASALLFGVTYMVLFIPILYMTDRFAYNRWQRRADAQAGSRAAKKR